MPDTSLAPPDPRSCTTTRRRILLLGATGTIGRATLRKLLERGHEVVCLDRPRHATDKASVPNDGLRTHHESLHRFVDVTDPECLMKDGIRGEKFDVLVSCMASRSGTPRDAWDIDYQAHVNALSAAKAAGVAHVVLLSAICVQKPMLPFQRAKLAFEQLLIDSGLIYTIVRPTAFFKSLSGQVERVKRGKSFLVFGDGTLTACKPISDHDLGEYIADSLDDHTRWNCVLPIAGPGEAITPRQQAECLFSLLKRPVRIRHVPIGLLDGIIRVLDILGKYVPALADKAEYARIGRYYATESMLVLNPSSGRYDAQLTPSTGTETLFDFYACLVTGNPQPDSSHQARPD